MPDLELRDKLSQLERAMFDLPDQMELPTEHFFAPGVYCRVLHMPAGAVVSGKIHKTEHFAVVLKGKLTVVTDEGGKSYVEAPMLMVTKPGTKRVAYVHEDATWATFHPTEETDLEKIEEDIIAKGFDDPDLIEYFKVKELEEKG